MNPLFGPGVRSDDVSDGLPLGGAGVKSVNVLSTEKSTSDEVWSWEACAQ